MNVWGVQVIVNKNLQATTAMMTYSTNYVAILNLVQTIRACVPIKPKTAERRYWKCIGFQRALLRTSILESGNTITKGCGIRAIKACLAEADAIECQLTPIKKPRLDFDSQHGINTPAVGT
jgi:hypothetical protein